NDVYAGVAVAPRCSSLLFAAYHVLDVWISIEGFSGTVYGNYCSAFEDAVTLEDSQNLVVCELALSEFPFLLCVLFFLGTFFQWEPC
ncbi:hypothetical protein MUP59_03950, partial [Candidatus Bathyarchaeota archaeon]|nr:hypothetical protein [Candidatus Bathyarchaeota archaeon]